MLLVKARKNLPKKLLVTLVMMIRLIVHKGTSYGKVFGRRKFLFLVPPLILLLLVLWIRCCLLMETKTLQTNLDKLQQLAMNRSLKHYMRNIQIMIDPLPTKCKILDVPLVVMVDSAPSNYDQRLAVRDTWAQYQPTYFLIGLSIENKYQQLQKNYKEAEQYGDLIIFGFNDNNQNLTLKTALMMKWALNRCPQARYMFKTADDVLVNPWALDKVLWENMNSELVGYSLNLTDLNTHRGDNKKEHIHKILRNNKVASYLSGTGYFIRRQNIEKILVKAFKVPMITKEDVYFTSLVAHKELGLSLKHDSRLSPYKPWIKMGCLYWDLATVHSVEPEEMRTAWGQIINLVISYNNTTNVCKSFNWYYNLINNMVMH